MRVDPKITRSMLALFLPLAMLGCTKKSKTQAPVKSVSDKPAAIQSGIISPTVIKRLQNQSSRTQPSRPMLSRASVDGFMKSSRVMAACRQECSGAMNEDECSKACARRGVREKTKPTAPKPNADAVKRQRKPVGQ